MNRSSRLVSCHRHQPPRARVEGRGALGHSHGVRPAVDRRAARGDRAGPSKCSTPIRWAIGRARRSRRGWRVTISKRMASTVEPEQFILMCGASPALVLALSFDVCGRRSNRAGAPGLCRLSQHAARVASHAGRDRVRPGVAISAHRGQPGRARSGAPRRHRREPRQSDRHDHRRRRAGGDRARVSRAQDHHHLGRDLSRPELRRAGALHAGVRAERLHRQQLLQILQHGRLAAGLVAGSAGATGVGRARSWATCF